MGIRGKISRNTLAHANEIRDWRIYADFAQALIRTARKLYSGEDFGLELDQTVYALDATIIALCLSVFPWAKFRRGKAAVKLHTLLDLRGSIPVIVNITHGKIHDVYIIDNLFIEAGAIYIMDRAYVDFARLYKIHRSQAFFVTRAKSNFIFKRLYSLPVDKSTGVQSDQIITVTGFYTLKGYPDKLRRIRYFDALTKKRFVFLTNNFSLPAIVIAKLYQMPLSNRTVLHMDQAAPEKQVILLHYRKCRQNSNMDRYLHLCAGSYRQETTLYQSQPLHNFTDFKRHTVRENTHFTGSFGC